MGGGVIVVTGGSGFVGGALVSALVADGRDVLVVDDVDPAGRLPGVAVGGHVAPDEFLVRLEEEKTPWPIEAVLHQGACSSTLVDDEAYLRRVNDGYSTRLLELTSRDRIPLIYASSAGVYGTSSSSREHEDNEAPLTPYACSKLRFDHVVGRHLEQAPNSQVVGLRYFNVFGPGEAHKGPMASMVHQLWLQLEATGEARLFGAGEGCGPGEHRRDFVFIDDVVGVIRYFLDHPEVSGIYNCGLGVSRSFRDLAEAVVAARGTGAISYVPFPDHLRGRYQADTCADLARLSASGCPVPTTGLEAGVASYVEFLTRQPPVGQPTRQGVAP